MLKSYNFPSVYEATNQELANVAENILDGIKVNIDDTDYIVVTFAKMVGGIDDENILEMLRTAKGFRKLVHSVGVSIVGDLPDKVVTFTLGFSGELGSGGSRNSMKITTDGTEHIMVMDEQQWSDSDETPQANAL